MFSLNKDYRCVDDESACRVRPASEEVSVAGVRCSWFHAIFRDVHIRGNLA